MTKPLPKTIDDLDELCRRQRLRFPEEFKKYIKPSSCHMDVVENLEKDEEKNDLAEIT